MKNVLITGIAGFIGFYLARRLLKEYKIIGVDNLNDYYDEGLKIARLKELGIEIDNKQPNKEYYNEQNKIKFIKVDISNAEDLEKIFEGEKIDFVIHLAAQAGVRYSIEHPNEYIQSNIIGSYNILENVKKYKIKDVIIASSSSVYGNNKNQPYTEDLCTNKPVSLYAATKTSVESLAYSYSNLFGLKTIILRFFTVYGPWGRPDMAYFSFTNSILEGIPIKIYNNGNLYRDFTYIDDIIEGICLIIDSMGNMPDQFNLFNIGSSKKTNLLNFIEILENIIGKKAIKEFVKMQQGDVYETIADISKINRECGYSPKVELKKGLSNFFEWYKIYYRNV